MFLGERDDPSKTPIEEQAIPIIGAGFVELDSASGKCGCEQVEVLSSEYTCRAGECIGECAGRSDNGGGSALGQAEAGARVDDV